MRCPKRHPRKTWSRLADVLVAVAPDGSLLVSDDDAGAIYRISYRGQRPYGTATGGRHAGAAR